MNKALLPISQFITAIVSSAISVGIGLALVTSGWGVWVLSLCAVAGVFPSIFIAPLLSPLLDTPKLPHLLKTLLFLEIIILLSSAAHPSPPILLIMVFLISSLNCLLSPTLLTLAQDGGHFSAQHFARMDSARTLGMLLGPPFGGLLFDIGAISFTIIIGALLLGIVVTIIATAKIPPPVLSSRTKEESWLTRITEAPYLILSNQNSRSGVLLLAAAVTFTAVYSVANVLLATQVLGLSGLGYALIIQAFVIGRLMGASLGAFISQSQAPIWLISACLIMGCGLTLAGAVPYVAIVALGFTAAGLANALQVAALRMVFVAELPAAVIPKALAALGSVNNAAMLIGLIAATPLINWTGADGALIVAGIGTIAITLCTVALFKFRSPGLV